MFQYTLVLSWKQSQLDVEATQEPATVGTNVILHEHW